MLKKEGHTHTHTEREGMDGEWWWSRMNEESKTDEEEKQFAVNVKHEKGEKTFLFLSLC